MAVIVILGDNCLSDGNARAFLRKMGKSTQRLRIIRAGDNFASQVDAHIPKNLKPEQHAVMVEAAYCAFTNPMLRARYQVSAFVVSPKVYREASMGSNNLWEHLKIMARIRSASCFVALQQGQLEEIVL